MTTVAADAKRGSMACDSMVSTTDSWWPSTKVHRAADALIGGAGEASSIRQFVTWYADGQRLPKPKIADNFCARLCLEVHMANLDTELKAYKEKLPTLLGQIGKYALLKGSEVVGVYDTYEDALKFGYEKFQLEPFLVKRIAPAEQISYFTRDFATACQA